MIVTTGIFIRPHHRTGVIIISVVVRVEVETPDLAITSGVSFWIHYDSFRVIRIVIAIPVVRRTIWVIKAAKSKSEADSWLVSVAHATVSAITTITKAAVGIVIIVII